MAMPTGAGGSTLILSFRFLLLLIGTENVILNHRKAFLVKIVLFVVRGKAELSSITAIIVRKPGLQMPQQRGHHYLCCNFLITLNNLG